MEKDKFGIQLIPGQFVKFSTREEIQGLVGSLGHTLTSQYRGEELIVVGVLKGCLFFLADLLRETKDVKIKVDFVKVKKVGRSEEHLGSLQIVQDITLDIRDKNVLLVEAVIDSGVHTHFIRERLALSGPKKIEIMTLFDRPYRRKIPLDIPYIGKKIDDEFLLGMGLDIEEYGRNLKDVYFLKYLN